MTPMHRLLSTAVAALALAACAPVNETPPSASAPVPMEPPKSSAPDAPPPPEETPMNCDAKQTAWAKGQLADEALVERIRTDTHSKGVRVIKPGMAVTMDYREDRVNIDVDDKGRVTNVRCG